MWEDVILKQLHQPTLVGWLSVMYQEVIGWICCWFVLTVSLVESQGISAEASALCLLILWSTFSQESYNDHILENIDHSDVLVLCNRITTSSSSNMTRNITIPHCMIRFLVSITPVNKDTYGSSRFLLVLRNGPHEIPQRSYLIRLMFTINAKFDLISPEIDWYYLMLAGIAWH